MENLVGKEAIKKIKQLVDKNGTCFFGTHTNEGGPLTVRPMAVQKVDDEGSFWFLSSVDSNKNEEIKTDDMVQLFFQGSPHSDFLTVYGKATITKDKNIIKELWEPMVKTWFTEGVDDPRITVIRVTPTGGYYWDTKHGNFVAGVKMLIGAAVGKTIDDSIEGKLNP